MSIPKKLRENVGKKEKDDTIRKYNMNTVIVGLGNPGAQYENTRHNVGFMAIDEFAEKNNFPEFKLQKKSESLVSENVLNGRKIVLAKPQTYMNNSGKAAKELINKESELVVVHDDIDLPSGKIKIIKERGSAGHKGVESIIQNIGNDGLIRIRIGIGLVQNEQKTKAENIVLKEFSNEESALIEQAIKKASSALEILTKEGLEKAMNEYNK